ncbi:HAD-IA family hydrolase [Mesorhizobium sp. SP-1A]|uniref:HAD family hydrolase n=1 Tax=Mesorhizobium sp. SP-1A TaxID=3077840 RepID=UPI0028F7000B|nr:HAD-IA family hydrolase [Mesorhizobium sp. SP-1A]
MRKDRALILDFGGVVTRTLFETHDITEKALGLPVGSLSWMGPFDASTDPLWVSMQKREITEREYWRLRAAEVGRLLGEDWRDMQTFVRRARGADPELVVRPEARRAIREVREAGLRLAILSNELDLFYGADFRKRLPLIEEFDVVVDATYTGILKPDPKAYELVIAALGLPRENCVFVDDQRKNIEGAEAVALPCVHFDVMSPEESYDRALELLGV